MIYHFSSDCLHLNKLYRAYNQVGMRLLKRATCNKVSTNIQLNIVFAFYCGFFYSYLPTGQCWVKPHPIPPNIQSLAGMKNKPAVLSCPSIDSILKSTVDYNHASCPANLLKLPYQGHRMAFWYSYKEQNNLVSCQHC